mgnify:CR=1 FL=1
MSSRDSIGVRPDTILDNLKTAVVCLDSRLRVTYLNTASEMLFGVSARHCGSEPFDRALPYLADHREKLESALYKGSIGNVALAYQPCRGTGGYRFSLADVFPDRTTR